MGSLVIVLEGLGESGREGGDLIFGWGGGFVGVYLVFFMGGSKCVC